MDLESLLRVALRYLSHAIQRSRGSRDLLRETAELRPVLADVQRALRELGRAKRTLEAFARDRGISLEDEIQSDLIESGDG
jgi:hypothetical protein